MPTCVAFTRSGQRLVGSAAKAQAASTPAGTVFGFKRLLDTQFSDRSTMHYEAQPWMLDIAEDGRDRPMVAGEACWQRMAAEV